MRIQTLILFLTISGYPWSADAEIGLDFFKNNNSPSLGFMGRPYSRNANSYKMKQGPENLPSIYKPSDPNLMLQNVKIFYKLQKDRVGTKQISQKFRSKVFNVDGRLTNVYFYYDILTKKDIPLSANLLSDRNNLSLAEDFEEFLVDEISDQMEFHINEKRLSPREDKALFMSYVRSRIRNGEYIAPNHFLLPDGIVDFFQTLNSTSLLKNSECSKNGEYTTFFPSLPPLDYKENKSEESDIGKMCDALNSIPEEEIERYISEVLQQHKRSVSYKRSIILELFDFIPSAYAAESPSEGREYGTPPSPDRVSPYASADIKDNIHAFCNACNKEFNKKSTNATTALTSGANQSEITKISKDLESSNKALERIAKITNDAEYQGMATENKNVINEIKTASLEQRMPDPRVINSRPTYDYPSAGIVTNEEYSDTSGGRSVAVVGNDNNSRTSVSSKTNHAPHDAHKSFGDKKNVVNKIANKNSVLRKDIERLKSALENSEKKVSVETKAEHTEKVAIEQPHEADRTSANTADMASAHPKTSQMTNKNTPENSKNTIVSSANPSTKTNSTGNVEPNSKSRSPASIPNSGQNKEIKNTELAPELKELFEKADNAEYLGELDPFLNFEGATLYINNGFFKENKLFNNESYWLKLILSLQDKKIRRIILVGNGKEEMIPVVGMNGSRLQIPKEAKIPEEFNRFRNYFISR